MTPDGWQRVAAQRQRDIHDAREEYREKRRDAGVAAIFLVCVIVVAVVVLVATGLWNFVLLWIGE